MSDFSKIKKVVIELENGLTYVFGESQVTSIEIQQRHSPIDIGGMRRPHYVQGPTQTILRLTLVSSEGIHTEGIDTEPVLLPSEQKKISPPS